MQRFLYLGAIMFLAGSSFSFLMSAEHTTDPLPAVRKAISEDKAVLIDVREKDEWNQGHVQGAIHIPLSELRSGINSEKLKKLIPAGKIVYVHCAAGGRCLKAADLFKEAGIETRPLKPGYNELIENNFPKAK